MSGYRNYYDSTFGRPRGDSTKKLDDVKSPTSRIATRYGGAYSSGYQRDTTASRENDTYSSRPETSRIKSTLDRKDNNHPPVSYKPLTRATGSRSRDPSPIERSDKSSSSSSGLYNPNRLYPRPYTRSTSRETLISPNSSTTNLPKYTGRAVSRERDDVISKYGARSSKDEIPKYLGRSSMSKDEPITSRYKTSASKEDNSKKYINSRFLPKNTVEKSYTAYTRPSALRNHETSRKNKELLTVLHAQQEQERLSRPTSRCSSVAPEDIQTKNRTNVNTPEPPIKEIVEMETVTVVTRGTSPTPNTTQSTSFLRSKRIEIAKVIEKQMTRPKTKSSNMVDKEIQSDRLDDSTKTSRFAGASRISATPWSSFLDMKFSSPNTKQKNAKSENQIENAFEERKDPSESPKSLSRTSSTKSITKSSNSKTDKSKINKKSPSPTYSSKLTPPKQISDKKQLPPQIPKNESTPKSSSIHSLNTPNKDFRKSVLNMNPDGKSKKKLGRNSNSVSSAESDTADPDATDISENLTSCKSFHKSSTSSKLPQKMSSDKSLRNRRSPSSDVSVSSATASSEDDNKTKKCNKLHSAGSSRTSMIMSSADDLSMDKNLKPPQSPKQKNETEAKSFLMRALAPVTNLFKNNKQQGGIASQDPNSEMVSERTETSLESSDQNKVMWIVGSSSDTPSERSKFSPPCTATFSEPRSAKIIIHRVESWPTSATTNENQPLLQGKSSIRPADSGEKPWWLDEQAEVPEGVETYRSNVAESSQSFQDEQQPHLKQTIRHNQSGETPWWLDEKVEPPEGVQTYPGWKEQSQFENTDYEPKKPIIRHVQSGEKAWWLDESSDVPQGVDTFPEWKQQAEPEAYKQDSHSNKQKPKIRHVDSGEKPWWLDENTPAPEGVPTYNNWVPDDNLNEDGKTIYKIRRNESGDSSWWLDSSSKSNTDSNKNHSQNIMDTEYQEKHKLRHIDSGDRSWWADSSENISGHEERSEQSVYHPEHQEKTWWARQDNRDDESETESEVPLGDRASPEGLEMPKDDQGRLSPYDNVPTLQRKAKRPNQLPLFISRHTNIDDILGGNSQMWSPLMGRIFGYNDTDMEDCKEIDPTQVIIHEGNKERAAVQKRREQTSSGIPKTFVKLDDAALQLYKDGDYGSYLDLEASISEQQEEFEGFQSNKKNSIVLRTQLSVRVHTIIEKLLTSEGRELRRALFSLKQIFQEDKDLVHEFVQNDGLSCLIKVGSEADQNYQNYILRALGQVMLYVDGMNGVMEHNQTIQWLYSLISSKFRLVVKTALKLLLVFVEYTDSNCTLLIKAIHTVDYSQGVMPYHNIMKLLKDFDSADTELLIYATTLINKVLNGVPDQDTYYDQVDALEEQGFEGVIQRYMSKPGTDLDLLQQFQIYEAVLQYEDGEEIGGTPVRHLDENIRKTLRNRKSVTDSAERRKSRRHSTGTTPLYGKNNNNNNCILQTNREDYDESSSSHSSSVNNSQLNGSYKDNNKAGDAGVTPALKRRRERAERQRSFMKEQQETAALLKGSPKVIQDNNEINNGNYTNALQQRIANGNLLNRNSSRKDLTPLLNAVNKLDSEEGLKQPWILTMIQNQENLEDSETANENERNYLIQLKRENTVKDLTQKLASQNILHSPSDENKVNRVGDMSGLISKAKEGLAKSKSKADVLKSPTNENPPKVEVKKSENELRWEELVANLNRSLNLCDMDFTDLGTDDEMDILAPTAVTNGIPPPPPPFLDSGTAPPPPPLNTRIPPPVPSLPLFSTVRNKSTETKIPIKKNKKTVKLFWKEVRDDPISHSKLKTGYIWDELSPVSVDTQKLEHLFESRAKDLITKKQQEMNKNKEIIVLDPKRSNAINIGMTKLPPPRSIKTAILKMDATIMNREGIEKLLTMLPTEEERTKIQEAQAANPDLPLGSAEQFLLTLASISELPARLKLWAFKLDFENSEREIAEPLMDLKQGFEVLRVNKTFRGILSTLLSIGNFLNGNEVKGFQIEYLAKVPEVKDTVHKHSLLHHLCHILMEKFPDASDLYSEIGAITRASKIDFDELALNIHRLEADCKASWDHLKLIAKHDGSTMMKVKMSDFLADCAERIILLTIVHRRIMNRFHKFLLWLGIPLHQIGDTKPNEFCRVVSEFALEYRTTRERVLQQLEKKANHRERNKTRGKMITDMGKFRTKEDRADAELRQLLGSDISDVESMQGTLPWRRTRRDGNRSFMNSANGNLTDGDDEILESLVKTATKGPQTRTAPRERKRTRHADRKSLKRSRTRENNPFGSRDSP